MKSVIHSREISQSMCHQLVAQGQRSRNVFPHRIYIVPAFGSDALHLGNALWHSDNPEKPAAPGSLQTLDVDSSDLFLKYSASTRLLLPDSARWMRCPYHGTLI